MNPKTVFVVFCALVVTSLASSNEDCSDESNLVAQETEEIDYECRDKIQRRSDKF
jgi:hypothetical protein